MDVVPTTNGWAPRAGRAFLRAPFSARTYRELLYLLVGSVVATVFFVLILVGLVCGLGLALTFLGLPLLALTVYAARGSGAAWRWLCRGLLRTAVSPPPKQQRRPGVLGFISSGLTNRAGWRAIGYATVKFPLALVGTYAVIIIWGFALGALTSPLVWAIGHPTEIDDNGTVHHSFVQLGGYYVDTWPEVIALSFVGLLLCFAAPWPVRGLTALDRWLVRFCLGPTARDSRVANLERQRAQVLDDSASTLRRVERDLHDGTQARLVSMAMSLGRAREKIESDPEAARGLIDSAHATAKDALTELRDVVRSISPPVLDRGLDVALDTLTSRSTVRTELHTRLTRRASPGVETIAYFCVAELLTNVARHSGATMARVDAWTTGDELRLIVWDNGSGGAVVGSGSGLLGLRDRVATVDGTLDVDSPAGGPTLVSVVLPAPELPR